MTPIPPPTSLPSPSPTPAPLPLGAGFRFSTYGPPTNPGPEYWGSVGQQIAAKFATATAASTPAAIWIVGNFDGNGVYLNFPCETQDPHIRCGFFDMNEEALALFDQLGLVVWLQVEPGDGSVDELIDLTLKQYGHHPSVAGFGIDVEWYHSTGAPEGQPVTDEEASRWVKAVRLHNPDYWLFLKHWKSEWLPPTEREGIFFVDDSQQFDSFDHMLAEFTAWGQHFAPSPVGFQYGYPADKPWWSALADPPADIGRALLAGVPNTRGLFWVDFTVQELFPPQP